MIEIPLASEDLARLRFARSPIQELVGSLHVLAEPKRQAMHRPWLAMVSSRLPALRLLPALIGGRHYVADFLTPPPSRVDTEFDEEVERVRAASPEAIRDALDELRDGEPLAAELRPLYDDPAAHLGALADELVTYWRAAIEPVWPRLRSLLDADLGYRAAELTRGGVVGLFSGLHPRVDYADDRLRIRTPNWSLSKSLRGTGLLLVPCVLAWPQLVVLVHEPYQPMLTYAPRGVATVWAAPAAAGSSAAPPHEPLGELVGRTRSALLVQLDLPLSTTQLAIAFDLTPATVSQHLSVLRRCGLVTSRRSGRAVLYQRTPLASRLLTVAATIP